MRARNAVPRRWPGGIPGPRNGDWTIGDRRATTQGATAERCREGPGEHRGAGAGSGDRGVAGVLRGDHRHRRVGERADRGGGGGEPVRQCGGPDRGPVRRVTSVESNPNTDPHTYEVTPGVAQAVSSAQIVIQNGVGYDDFMNKIESASPNPHARGDRRPAPARPARQHPESPPLVQPDDHAQGGRAPWPPTFGQLAAGPRRLLQGQRRQVRGLAQAVAGGHRPVQGRLRRDPGGDHRAGGRLHAGGGRHGQPDAVQAAGRHHERGRSRPRRTCPSRPGCSPGTR